MEVCMNVVRLGRQSVKIFFILVLSCLFTLGPGSLARAGASVNEELATPPGFHVSGDHCWMRMG
jgi:hypothetical protein